MVFRKKINQLLLGIFSFLLLFLSFISVSYATVSVDYKDYYSLAYQQGTKQHIIRQTITQFTHECQHELGPEYVKYVKSGGNDSFPAYAKLNYYGQVDPGVAGSKPQTIMMNFTYKSISPHIIRKNTSSYHMRAGDILICHGGGSSGSIGGIPGHAAIADSSSRVLEMPGGNYGYAKKHNAHNTKKNVFFKRHVKKKGNCYVIVYRMRRSKLAKKAASYAYRRMYKKDNPNYSILAGINLYKKNPSYCSKYVYLSYYFGVSRKTVHKHPNWYFVTPYGLPGNFSVKYKPHEIYKIAM